MLTKAILWEAALRISEANQHVTQFSCFAVRAAAGEQSRQYSECPTRHAYEELLIEYGGSTGGGEFQRMAHLVGSSGAAPSTNLNRTLFLLLLIESGACD